MELISRAARAADLRLAADLVERHPEKIAELRAAEVAQRDAARAKAAAELAKAETDGAAEVAAASRARDATQVEALRAAGVWQARCNDLKLVEAALAGAEARRDIAIDRPTRRLREIMPPCVEQTDRGLHMLLEELTRRTSSSTFQEFTEAGALTQRDRTNAPQMAQASVRVRELKASLSEMEVSGDAEAVIEQKCGAILEAASLACERMIDPAHALRIANRQ